MRIFEAATRDGAADAARGHLLRLESGSALRVITGGAIGVDSAASLRDGMGWLAEASRARRAQRADATARVWRAARGAVAATVVALAVGAEMSKRRA